MIQNLKDIQVTYSQPMSIFCDNINAISISKNPVMHSNIKHIPIKYHILIDKFLDHKVKLEYAPSSEHIADIFIKPLLQESF